MHDYNKTISETRLILKTLKIIIQNDNKKLKDYLLACYKINELRHLITIMRTNLTERNLKKLIEKIEPTMLLRIYNEFIENTRKIMILQETLNEQLKDYIDVIIKSQSDLLEKLGINI